MGGVDLSDAELDLSDAGLTHGDDAGLDPPHGHADLDPDGAEVLRRELSLLNPQVRGSTEATLALLHPEFREFGASGRVWDPATLTAALAEEPEPEPGEGADDPVAAVGDMTCTRLAPDVILLTYTARDPERVTRRSSIWIRDPSDDEGGRSCGEGRPWLMRFHQGTVVPGAQPMVF